MLHCSTSTEGGMPETFAEEGNAGAEETPPERNGKPAISRGSDCEDVEPRQSTDDFTRSDALQGRESSKERASAAGVEGPVAAHGEQALSKNAQKRLLKQARYEEKRKARKAHEKQLRHASVERRRQEWDAMMAELPPEVQQQKKAQLKDQRRERKLQDEDRKQRLRESMHRGQQIAIDLDFGHLMRPAEIRSLMQQVMYCYGANSRAAEPCRLFLTGCQGAILQQTRRISGFQNWRLQCEQAPYIDVFAQQRDKLVYLTADSPTVIHQLKDDRIYIIGGLVDRNRFKDITLKKAQEQGIATAKLPIGQYLNMQSSQVLTVNQVFDILLGHLATQDWRQAIQTAVPQRKRAAMQEPKHSADCHEAIDRPTSRSRSEPGESNDDVVETSTKDVEGSHGDGDSHVMALGGDGVKRGTAEVMSKEEPPTLAEETSHADLNGLDSEESRPEMNGCDTLIQTQAAH